MSFFQIMMSAMPDLLRGLLYTLEYSVLGIFLAFVIGLISAFFKLSKFWILRFLGNVYVEAFRCTPLFVQALFIYNGVPMILPVHKWVSTTTYLLIAGVVSLMLNEGAYITEIIRAGIVSVDKGQFEAAHSLGMNKFQAMFHIILPQAFKRMIPPLVNQTAQTIKDTSMLSAISVTELVYSAQIVISTNFAAFQIWTAVLAIYFIVIYLVTRIAAFLERRLQVDKR